MRGNFILSVISITMVLTAILPLAQAGGGPTGCSVQSTNFRHCIQGCIEDGTLLSGSCIISEDDYYNVPCDDGAGREFYVLTEEIEACISGEPCPNGPPGSIIHIGDVTVPACRP